MDKAHYGNPSLLGAFNVPASAAQPPITAATQQQQLIAEDRLRNVLDRLQKHRIRLVGVQPEAALPPPPPPDYGADGYLGENYHSIYRINCLVDVFVYELERLEAL
jgi:hypothetical protein